MVENCGIILAGGNGLRLRPLTKVLNKHLLPVYDKPMIFYPLATLMLAGIQDIAIITKPDDSDIYSRLFSNPQDLGINITFLTQESPIGVPDAYLIAKNFIANRNVVLILGDNIFVGNGLGRTLKNSFIHTGAKTFAFPVTNPEDYGIASFDKNTNKLLKIVEKPKNYIGNLAIPGLYFTDSNVCSYASELKVSKRGELEISDLLNKYLAQGKLEVEVFDRGIGWVDAGTIESLHAASNLIEVLQSRQGFRFNIPEEIAWRNNWISSATFQSNIKKYQGTDYGDYLTSLLP